MLDKETAHLATSLERRLLMPPSRCETSAFAASCMGRFAITLTAAALAAAIAGPASADLEEGSNPGAYAGNQTTLKIIVAGCPNDSQTGETVIGFDKMGRIHGYWGMDISSFGEDGLLGGLYIERKVGKDLTLALSEESYAALLDVLFDYVDDAASKCDLGSNEGDFDDDDFEVKKAQGKLTRKGDRIKVSIEVSGKYTNSNNKRKNLKLKIDGLMNFDSNAPNPAEMSAAGISSSRFWGGNQPNFRRSVWPSSGPVSRRYDTDSATSPNT